MNDAYEAAQHILKTINFGRLLQLPENGSAEGTTGDGEHPTSAGESIPDLGAGSSVGNGGAEHHPVADASAVAGIMMGSAGALDEADEHQRAELQAQLALLSAQLTELAQEMQAETEVPAVEGNVDVPMDAEAEGEEDEEGG